MRARGRATALRAGPCVAAVVAGGVLGCWALRAVAAPEPSAGGKSTAAPPRAVPAAAGRGVSGSAGATEVSPGAAAGGSPSGAGAAGASTGAGPHLDDDTAVLRAAADYESGRYPECVAGFGALLDPASSERLAGLRARDRAHVYRAACLLAMSKTDEADRELEEAVRANPQIALPDSVTFPSAVIERFLLVRGRLVEHIQRQERQAAEAEVRREDERRRTRQQELERLRHLELLAGQETLVTRNRRWLASVPFGVGQFQNRSPLLGGVFLGAEAALLSTAVTATSIQLSLYSQAGKEPVFFDPAKAELATSKIALARTVSLASAAGFVLVAVLGVVEAHLSYVPEFRDGVRRSRAAPSASAPRPTALLVPELGEGGLRGCSLAWQGSF